MHPALNIDQILRIVFRTIATLEQYHLALTCKSFLEPALDELWYEVQDSNRLFRLLPMEVLQNPAISLVGIRRRAKAVILTRPVSLNEWDRFDWYAKRVRRVHLLAYHYFPPESQAYLQASMLERSTPLFPNVSWIKFDDDSATSPIAVFFISASVREVHAAHTPEECELWSNEPLVQAITQIIPSLSSLSLPSIKVVDDFTQALVGAAKLRHIGLWKTVDWGTVKLFGSLPMLQRVIIHRLELGQDVNEGVGDDNPWFPSLKNIWAKANTVVPVLSRIKHRSVKYVHLILESSGSDVVAAQQCIEMLDSSILHPLCITITQRYLPGSPTTALNLIALQDCVGLREFNIRSENNQEPTTEVWLTLAAAWRS